VGRRVEDDVRRAALDDCAGPVPLYRLDRHVDIDRERPARPERVRTRRSESEVDVVVDPLTEETRPRQRAESVADRDAVTRRDLRNNVENPRDRSGCRAGSSAPVLIELDDDQVVLVGGVRPVRTADGPRFADDPGDRRDPRLAVRVESIAQPSSCAGYGELNRENRR